MNFINIHRHGPAAAGEFGIENIYKNFDHPPAAFFSAGLHPWHIKEPTWETELEKLKNIAGHTAMLAIGECGLDKVCETDYRLQQKAFDAQVQLANIIHKPLIIHCVRAYDDVMQLLKKEKNKMPVVFHGFNKSLELANTIISKGYYLSFGSALMKANMQSIFASIPLQYIFLETDNSNISIEEMYTMVAEIRDISVEELSLQIKNNLKLIFNTAI